MLFGSDTHSLNWDNSVRVFDMGTLRWSSAYVEDDPATYRVNGNGIPVAGSGVERPWAMHTFDAVEFDPIADKLIIASHPGHMSPKKKWGVKKELWRQIRSHPTWAYSVSDDRWEPMLTEGVSFFPYAAAFDMKEARRHRREARWLGTCGRRHGVETSRQGGALTLTIILPLTITTGTLSFHSVPTSAPTTYGNSNAARTLAGRCRHQASGHRARFAALGLSSWNRSGRGTRRASCRRCTGVYGNLALFNRR